MHVFPRILPEMSNYDIHIFFLNFGQGIGGTERKETRRAEKKSEERKLQQKIHAKRQRKHVEQGYCLDEFSCI